MEELGHPPDPIASIRQRLRERLLLPLPGAAAHERMAPRPRRRLAPGVDPERPIPAAVLVLLMPGRPVFSARSSAGVVPSELRLLLTRRSGAVATHKGQVCFPGGALEPGELPEHAALREAHEEVGVEPTQVELLGALTPVFVPVTGFRIQPFLGTIATRPQLRAAAAEVERLLEVPLTALHDPLLRSERAVARDDGPGVIPCFRFDGEEVWGATAMVLAELTTLLAELFPDDFAAVADQRPT